MKRQMDQALLHKATEAQNKAADPVHHVWVGANAGTGKTRVLASRVVRLLVADGALLPAEILALTYTRAGATEMAGRLPKVVRRWDGLSDEALTKELRSVGVADVDSATLQRARQLPGLMRAAPVRVFTLHGFAQAVLSRFSDEAGLPLGFGLLDEPGQKRMLREAVHEALVTADEGTDAALQELLEHLGDNALHELTEALVNDWARLVQLLGGEGGLAGALERLHGQLGLDDEAEMPTLEVALPVLRAWLAALEGNPGSKNDEKALAIRDVMDGKGDVVGLFLKDDGQPYKTLGTKAVQQAMASGWDDLLALQGMVQAAHQHGLAQRVEAMTRNLLVWVAAVQAAYASRKALAGVADFNDLIAKLEALLAGPDGGAVLARLDQRVKHLLVDEGQDNSPAQHRIVVALANELLAGQGVGDSLRTVFAVGDVKQNIYRFQGADPRLFADMHDQMVHAAGHTAKTVHLGHSFRSCPAVLRAVDAVFQAPAMASVVMGGAMDTGWSKHESVYPTAPGRVEMWPLVKVEKAAKEDGDGWPVAAPVEASGSGAGVVVERLADAFKRWIANGEVLGCTGKAVGYGDILVLVQTNATAAVVAAGLMRAGIPVALAGKESLSLLADDLVAWLRAGLNRNDRVALAQVLKSPLGGWSDAQLCRLAEAAGDECWHDHVAAVDAPTAAWLAEGWAYLNSHTVHAALVWVAAHRNVIGAYGGGDAPRTAAAEAALAGLLGVAAGVDGAVDVVALCEQAKPTPSALRASGAVRVMTVHASKGLEAPVVVVAEVQRDYDSRADQQKLVWGEDANGNPVMVAWRPGKKERPDALLPLLDDENKRLRADSYRSLYVALTRASERLLICGWEPSKGDVAAVDAEGLPFTWHGALKDTLPALAGWQADGDGGVLAEGDAGVAEPDVQPDVELPDGWNAAMSDIPLSEHVQTEALWRGEVIHMLIETLPHVAQAEWEDVGLRLAREMAPAWAAQTCADAVAEAIGVMEKLPWLFGPGSRAEAGLALGKGLGRIDRLVPTKDALWIIDFKTEAQPPVHVPAEYHQQLTAYAQALRPTSPLPVRAAVVWTAPAMLVDIDGSGPNP